MIRGLVPPERLLEWKVEDGWEPLCKFLGKEVPHGQPFPRRNDSSEFQKKVENGLQRHKVTVLKNLLLTFTCLVAVLAFVWQLVS